MAIIGWIKSVLKFLFVDSTTNILGDLLQQPLIMWAFIGWGWLSVLAMIMSIIDTAGQVSWIAGLF